MARSTSEATRAADRRRQVADLYLTGKSQYAIAAALKVSQPTVCRDLVALRTEWRAAAALKYNQRVDEELARINRLEAEAWEAWARSRRDAEVSTVEQSTDVGGSKSKARKQVEGRDGDPRFLQLVDRCITRRCELLGLDAPERFAATIGGDPDAPVKHEHDVSARLDGLTTAFLGAAAREKARPLPGVRP